MFCKLSIIMKKLHTIFLGKFNTFANKIKIPSKIIKSIAKPSKAEYANLCERSSLYFKKLI